MLRLEEPGFAPLTISGGSTGATSYGTFSLDEVVSETNPVVGNSSLAEIDFYTDIATSVGGALTITVEGTDYALPAGVVNPLTLTATTQGVVLDGPQGSTGSFEGWASAADLSPLSGSSTAIPPGSVNSAFFSWGPPGGPYSTFSFSATGTVPFVAGPGPFSLFSQSVVDLEGPGNVQLSGSVSVPTPAPPQAIISITPGQTSRGGPIAIVHCYCF